MATLTLRKRKDGASVYYATFSIDGRQVRRSTGTALLRIAEVRLAEMLRQHASPDYYPVAREWNAIVDEGVATSSAWASRMYQRTKDRANLKEIVFDLSKRDFVDLLRATKGRCDVTKIKFDWDRRCGSLPPFAPSLDRIRPNQGYVLQNVRIVVYALNVALSDWGVDVFEIVAQEFLENGKRICLACGFDRFRYAGGRYVCANCGEPADLAGQEKRA